MRIGLILAGTVLGLLAILALVPRFIDWTAQRQWIEAGLAAALDEPVRINGAVDAIVLPAPALVAQDIRIGGPDRTVAADIGVLEVRLRLGPLFAGRFEVERLVVQEATVETRDTPPSEQGDVSSPEPAPADSLSLTLDDVDLTNVVWRVDGETLVFPQASLSARSLSGPYTASGVITWRGADVSFDLGLERLREDRAAGLTVALIWPDGAEASFNGSADHEQSPWQFAGALTGQGPTPISWLSALGLDYPSALQSDLDARLNARLSGNFSALSVDEMRLAVGRSRLTGSAAFDWTGPHMTGDATLSLGQLDLDELLAPDATQIAEPQPDREAPQSTEPGDGPQSGGWALRLSATADLISWRGGVLSNAGLRGLADPSGLTLETGSAQLPGATSFATTGRVPWSYRGHWDLGFEGTTANARALAAWAGLGQAIQMLPAGRLSRASVSGRLVGPGPEVRIELGQAQIDQTLLSGVVFPQTPDQGLVFDLSMPSLTLDMMMPEFGGPAPQIDAGGSGQGDPSSTVSRWQGRLQLGSVLYQGRRADGVSLELRNSDAGLHIDRVEIADVDGVALTAFEIPLRPAGLSAFSNSQLEVSAPDLRGVLRLFDQPQPAWLPEGDFSLRLAASPGGDPLALAVIGAAGEAQVSGTLILSGTALSVEAWQAELTGRVDTSAIGGGVSSLGLGPDTEFVFSGSGTKRRGDIKSLGLRGPGGQLRGSGWVTLDQAGVEFDADVTLSSIPSLPRAETATDVEPEPVFRRPRTTETPIDLDWVKALDGQMTVRLDQAALFGFPPASGAFLASFGDAALEVSDLDLEIGSGRLTGGARVLADEPGLSGVVQAAALPLGGDRTLSLTFTGATQGPTSTAWVTGLTGQGTYLVAADPTREQRRVSLSALLAPFDGLAAIGQFLARRQGPSTLETDFQVFGGVIGFDDLRFTAPSYRGRFDGRFDLNAWDLDASGRVDLIGSTISRLLGQQVTLPGVLPIEVTGDPAEPRIKVDISGGLLPD